MVGLYFDRKNHAEANRLKEDKSSLKIQSVFRGYAKRKRYYNQIAKCISIQKLWRAWKGRLYVEEQREIKLQTDKHKIFDHFATLIQRVFRGYYSRTYYHDYHARKAYIATVMEKNQKMIELLDKEFKQHYMEIENKKQENTLRDFHDVTSNLHHLISTKSIPGVYKQPHRFESTETIFNVSIEDHLRNTSRVRNIYINELHSASKVITVSVMQINFKLFRNPLNIM